MTIYKKSFLLHQSFILLLHVSVTRELAFLTLVQSLTR